MSAGGAARAADFRRSPQAVSEAARALHVAALPFPHQQGTQAAINEMLATLAQAGRDHHLLTYAHGTLRWTGNGAATPFPFHRSEEWLRYRTLRSGPNLHKLLADAALGLTLRRVQEQLRPELIVAHHVEAAAIAGRDRPVVFFAHTDLESELPCYAPARLWAPLQAPLRWAGARLDRFLVRRCDAVAAISPALAQRMRALAGPDAVKVHYVPLPWSLPPAIASRERISSRSALRVPERAPVLLYAGNLDRYQGWEEVIDALAISAEVLPELILLVGTASDPTELWLKARAAGVDGRVVVVGLSSEARRRQLHAAADLALVPRRAAGGVPVKLIDAMARGVPTVVTPTAISGLELDGAAHVAEHDGAAAISRGVLWLLSDEAARRGLARRARHYVATRHAPACFVRAFDAVCAHAQQVRRDRRQRS
jgi:glycosyltransferase involved in cell wall biosynthesis